VERFPDAGLVPVAEAAPVGHPRAAAHLRREHLSGDAGAEDEGGAGEGSAVGYPRASAAWSGWVLREQRLDDGPEGVGEERCGHTVAPRQRSGAFVSRS
jgi:hypothetical protein